MAKSTRKGSEQSFGYAQTVLYSPNNNRRLRTVISARPGPSQPVQAISLKVCLQGDSLPPTGSTSPLVLNGKGKVLCLISEASPNGVWWDDVGNSAPPSIVFKMTSG